MKALLFIISIGLLIPCKAQRKASLNTTAEIAAYIASRNKNPREELYAAYTWVTSNIHYSKDSALIINRGMGPRARIDVALKRRKGVCENFSAIFSEICTHLGFTAVVIDGYTLQNGSIDYAGHSWSGVFFENEWYLFDPTWDAGRASGFRYFMRTGSDFITDHIPFDPLWQMLEHPYSFHELGKRNQRGRKKIFNYADSITHYLALDSISRYMAAERRISRERDRNQNSKEYLKLVKSRLEEERQQNQVDSYNAAIGLMNEASQKLNAFIQLRNQQFSSSIPNSELNEILSAVASNLQLAMDHLDRVDRSPATLVYGTGPAREHLKQLEQSCAQQTKFLEQYLKKESVIR